MSLCTLTSIVWGRRELLRKRDKDCQQRPGLTPTPGLSRACQHVQRACSCSAAAERQALGAAAAGGWRRQRWSQQDCGRERGWRRRAPAWLVPQKNTVPKENRPSWRSPDRRAVEGRCCSGELHRGMSAATLPCSQTGGCLGRTGWEIPPWGALSHGTLPHPLPTGCSASAGRADPLTALGPGTLAPTRAGEVGGNGMLCCRLLQHDKWRN